jgi:hypothetical protein
MRRRLVHHPVLFALFPPLNVLVGGGLENYWPDLHLLEMAMVAACACLAWCLLNLAVKDWEKSALVLSLFLLLIFSYAHIKPVWPIAAGLVLLAVRWLIRTQRSLEVVTSFMNLMATTLVLLAAFIIIAYGSRARDAWRRTPVLQDLPGNPFEPVEPASMPDIYYVILDAYARADVLEELYQFDNSEFVRWLRERGFYLAQRSIANYAHTTHSLSSSLNMDYLDDLSAQFGPHMALREPLRKMILESRVFRFLRKHGYKVVSFHGGYSPVDVTNADLYLAPYGAMDTFQVYLLHSTPIPALLGRLTGFDEYESARSNALFKLEHLARVPDQNAPIFVHVHIGLPHPPFIFGPNGEKVNPQGRLAHGAGRQWRSKMGFTEEEYRRYYAAQVAFLNGKVMEALDELLTKATRPTVVVLQADHGADSRFDFQDAQNTDMKERFAILNAYYLPGCPAAGLYDDISPVNTFRLVLNCYFRTGYELLPDESYFNAGNQPFHFISVSDRVR